MPIRSIKINEAWVDIHFIYDKGTKSGNPEVPDIPPSVQIWQINTDDVFDLLRNFDILKDNNDLDCGLLDYIEQLVLKQYK